MAETVTLERVPIATDQDGVIRVCDTRIPLDTIVSRFEQGATPERIVGGFPSLPLADVYQVIAYYLRHREELLPYFERRAQEAEEVHKVIEARWPPEDIRARLLARRPRA